MFSMDFDCAKLLLLLAKNIWKMSEQSCVDYFWLYVSNVLRQRKLLKFSLGERDDTGEVE